MTTRNHTRSRNRAAGGPPGPAAYAGPLDSVGGLVQAAYSCRRLRGGYDDLCLRLRRGSDNAQADFGFAPIGLLDKDAISTWLNGADGFVVAWYDQSGNGRTMEQSTAGNQPLLELSGALPLLAFDGSNDGLQYDAGSGNAAFSSATAWLTTVINTPAGDNDYRRIGSVVKDGTNDYDDAGSFNLSFNGANRQLLAQRDAATGCDLWQVDVPYVAAARFEAVNLYATVNGLDGMGNTQAGTFAPRWIAIAKPGGNSFSHLQGLIGEWILFSDLPDSGDRAALTADQVAYWDVPTVAP